MRSCVPLHGYHCANGAVKCALKCEGFILNGCVATSTNLCYKCYIVRHATCQNCTEVCSSYKEQEISL